MASIKRFTSILSHRRILGGGGGGAGRGRDRGAVEEELPEGDGPEATAAQSIKLFCESGGPNSGEQGEEVLHLPVIVEAAESSPQAAAVAASHIRKFLSRDNSNRPHVQYNAIMLIRILADNPGPSFTRNIDSKFVSTLKSLLRESRDPSVQQLLRETLGAMYTDKAYDANLSLVFQMWSKEQGGIPPSARVAAPNGAGLGAGPGAGTGAGGIAIPSFGLQQGTSFPRGIDRSLPAPPELALRIEEARTSAKLLQQLVQSSAPAEIQSNDLIKEFAERCQTAQRSLQGYIAADNPPPDDDTMQTLIETSELLSLAASKHSRAVLQARRALGQTTTPPPSTIGDGGAATTTTTTAITGTTKTSALPPLPPTNNINNDFAPVVTTTVSVPPVNTTVGVSPPSSAGLPPHTSNNLYTPTAVSPISPYAPPPLPPPSSFRGSFPRQDASAATSYNPPSLPPPSAASPLHVPFGGLSSHPNSRQQAPGEDPFSDANAAHENSGTAGATAAAGVSSLDALRPGFVPSTESYLRRQASANENITMHSAGVDDVSPVAVTKW